MRRFAVPIAALAVMGFGCGSSPEAITATSRAGLTDLALKTAPEKAAHVVMTCNTMVGTYEVDPAAAALVLPPEYSLALHTSSGGQQKGLVYLQTSKCNGTGNGEDISPFDLSDAWLIIDGPVEVVDVPGAAFTIPTTWVYVLKAQTTSTWVKEHCAAIQFSKELINALNISEPTATPPRSGNVVEMTGKGYSWTEFLPCVTPPGTPYGECWMFPGSPVPVGYGLTPLPIGINVKGYINQGNGKVAKKEMACVMNMFGQGLIQLDIDAKSHMMEAGVFGTTQIGLSFDAAASCDLMMTPL